VRVTRSNACMCDWISGACTTESSTRQYLLFSSFCWSDVPKRHSSSRKFERNWVEQLCLKFSIWCCCQSLYSHWDSTPPENFKYDLVSHLRNAWKISAVISMVTDIASIKVTLGKQVLNLGNMSEGLT
jgi:hypothetical protein